MADDGFNCSYLLADDGDDKLCIDYDTIMSVLDEATDPSESSPEDSSLKNISPGESGIHDNFQRHNGNSVLDCEHENQGPSSQTFSSPNAHAGGFRDINSVVGSDENCVTQRAGVSNSEIPDYFADPRFPDPEANSSNLADNLDLTLWKCENDSQIKHVGYDAESEYASHGSITENVDVKFEDYGTYTKDIIGVSGKQENDSCTSFEMPFVDADGSSHVATSTDSSICQGSNVPSDFSDYYLSLNCYQGVDDKSVVANTSGCLSNGVYPHMWENEDMMRNSKVAKMEFFADAAHVNSGMHSSSNGGISFYDSQYMFSDCKYATSFPGNVLTEDNASLQNSTRASYISNEGQSLNVKAERDELIMPYQNSVHNDDTEFNAGQEMKQLPGIFPAVGYQGNGLFRCEDSVIFGMTEKATYYRDAIDGTANNFPGKMGNLNLKPLDKSLYNAQTSIASGKQYNCVMSEGEGKTVELRSIDSQLSKGTTERSNIEEDSDVCIIEDISHPAPISQSAELGNSLNTSQSSRSGYSRSYMVGGMRPNACDEQYILRVALQDLSQPKSEVSPPDGLLAVPLLRHQG